MFEPDRFTKFEKVEDIVDAIPSMSTNDLEDALMKLDQETIDKLVAVFPPWEPVTHEERIACENPVGDPSPADWPEDAGVPWPAWDPEPEPSTHYEHFRNLHMPLRDAVRLNGVWLSYDCDNGKETIVTVEPDDGKGFKYL